MIGRDLQIVVELRQEQDHNTCHADDRNCTDRSFGFEEIRNYDEPAAPDIVLIRNSSIVLGYASKERKLARKPLSSAIVSCVPSVNQGW